MARATAKEVRDTNLSQNHTPAAIGLQSQPPAWARPAVGSISQVRRLDVDAVLERSMRKVASTPAQVQNNSR